MKIALLIMVMLIGMGCESSPVPFEAGLRVSPPPGYHTLSQLPKYNGDTNPSGLWRKLQRIHGDLKRSFYYMSDEDKYGDQEYWATTDESIDSRGVLTGDCEDFAIALMEVCAREGIRGRLVLCKPYGKGPHLVLEVGGFILDNRQADVVGREYLDYTWIKLLDYDGRWRAIK